MPALKGKATVPLPLPGRGTAMLQHPAAHILIIIVLGLLIYSNTFNVPFLFDDNLVFDNKNTALKDSRQFDFAARTVADNLNNLLLGGNRQIGFLTFALNYKVHGLQVTGYHVVNFFIHLISALLVYGLVMLTFRTPFAADYLQRDIFQSFDAPRGIALFTALLFVSHPVQIQAVTYIVQRYASLAALFYLASVVLYIKVRVSVSASLPFRYTCYGAALVCAVLAMKTKEISFTLPFMIILYEFMFFKGELKKRILYLFPFFLTLFIIPLTMLGGKVFSAESFSSGVSTIDKVTRVADEYLPRWDYLLTQFRVIVTYLRLLFFPVNQNLDYDYPIYRTFFNPEVMLSFLFLLALFGFGGYLLYVSSRKEKNGRFWLRAVSFGIFWFFVTLSVESSIIPIADVIFEHRLYLPSVGFFMALMSGVGYIAATSANRSRLIRQAFIPVMILVVLGLSVAAYARNAVWGDGISLWEDVVRKSPNKGRPHYTLGSQYMHRDRFDEAIKEYERAKELIPYDVGPYNDLGLIYLKQNRFDEAIMQYQMCLQLKPGNADLLLHLSNVYTTMEKFDEAEVLLKKAIASDPAHIKAHNNLGFIYAKQRRFAEAAREFQAVLKIDPDHEEARFNLEKVQSEK